MADRAHSASFVAPVAVEGRITRLVYFAPLGKSPIEMHRNYLQALAGAGFKAVVNCTPKDSGCDKLRFGFTDRGLAADGKIALYGIYFDTGKAEVKPASKTQVAEIAKLLKAQPALKVVLVGHTDNQGALDANLALSQQRAQAVAEALAKGHQIDAKRRAARGVASLAPVASNAAEEGRAKNRRVELVVPGGRALQPAVLFGCGRFSIASPASPTTRCSACSNALRAPPARWLRCRCSAASAGPREMQSSL